MNELMIAAEDFEYAPVAGLRAPREAVADHYNQTYRKGLPPSTLKTSAFLRWAGGSDAYRRGPWFNQLRSLFT